MRGGDQSVGERGETFDQAIEPAVVVTIQRDEVGANLHLADDPCRMSIPRTPVDRSKAGRSSSEELVQDG